MTILKQCKIAIAAVALWLLLPQVAHAHQSSVKYLELEIHDATADLALRVLPTDLAEVLDSNDDSDPTVATAIARADAVRGYVRPWMTFSQKQVACSSSIASVAAAHDPRFVEVRWRATCATTIDAFELNFAGFFEIDSKHVAMLRVKSPGVSDESMIVRADEPAVILRLGEAPRHNAWAWIRTGMDHIYSGTDHMCFLLVLLLVVVLGRDGDGARTWRAEPLTRALRKTATIVTAFTVAHSITLIAASLNVITLPGRVVESAIAASIVYTAIENMLNPAVRWRFVLSFVFGLIHGLGFASVLAELLPATDVVSPLLLFNVGVELGQLSLVIVAVPALWLLVRSIGIDRYRRWVLPGMSALAACAGLWWLLERFRA
jgi:hypothetical protein